jgi:carboxyl-terminal processing protease
MKTRRIAFGILILSLLACNFVTQMVLPPTATPPPTPTLVPTTTPSPTPTPLVPAYVPPQCANQPLATVSPEIALAQPTLNARQNPEISEQEQLEVFQQMTRIIDEVYVYPDFNGKDWAGIKQRYQEKIKEGLRPDAFYKEMRAMVYELGDNHSDYLSPVEAEASAEELEGGREYVGIGIYSIYNPDRQSLMVVSTIPGSAAEYAGLHAHDSILLVDGLPVIDGVNNRIRGIECSVLVLKVQSPGEAPRDVMLMRQSVEGGPPVDVRLVSTTDGSKIGYIFLPSFFDETLPGQVEAALKDFGDLDGLVIDLRLNGGGASTVAYPILGRFIKGRVGKFVSRHDSRLLRIEAHPIGNSQKVPLVVLVSEDTVSFGELFAGILQDAGRAKIVGETTLGNVEVLRGYPLDDSSVLWIASETFDSAFSDADWEQTGIVPDVEAFAEWDTFHFETDPSIAAALELLGHK